MREVSARSAFFPRDTAPFTILLTRRTCPRSAEQAARKVSVDQALESSLLDLALNGKSERVRTDAAAQLVFLAQSRPKQTQVQDADRQAAWEKLWELLTNGDLTDGEREDLREENRRLKEELRVLRGRLSDKPEPTHEPPPRPKTVEQINNEVLAKRARLRDEFNRERVEHGLTPLGHERRDYS
jgi:hypothetical protein